MTSAAPFHAGPLHLMEQVSSFTCWQLGQCLTTTNFPGFQSWDQPNSRSSGGSFPLKPRALGECGVTSNAPNRAAAEARIPVPPTRTAANPRVLLAADVGALPRLLSEGVQFAIFIPVDDDARPSDTTTSHDTPLETTDDTSQEGLAARSSCTSIGRIVSVPRRLSQQRRQTTSLPSTSTSPRMTP